MFAEHYSIAENLSLPFMSAPFKRMYGRVACSRRRMTRAVILPESLTQINRNVPNTTTRILERSWPGGTPLPHIKHPGRRQKLPPSKQNAIPAPHQHPLRSPACRRGSVDVTSNGVSKRCRGPAAPRRAPPPDGSAVATTRPTHPTTAPIDCGVFVIKFADALAEEHQPRFTLRHNKTMTSSSTQFPPWAAVTTALKKVAHAGGGTACRRDSPKRHDVYVSHQNSG